MESIVVASKAFVQICIPKQDGSKSYQYAMDLVFEGNTFHCKLSTTARLINTANNVKKAFVYLFLDASHVQSLEVCDNDEEAVPSCVKSAFVKRAFCTSADSILGLRFVLKGHAPLVTPDSTLQKRPSACENIEALLRIGQFETFTVYVPSSAISRDHLSRLCTALAGGLLKPSPVGVINSLYTTTNSKIVTHLDELWIRNPLDNPPPYDPSAAPGASKNDSTGPPDFATSSVSRALGKRRIASPALHQTPSKRRLLTERVTPEPWELAIAAQSAQIAALRAELSSLREEMQQHRRAAVVNVGTQTAPLVEPRQVSPPVSEAYNVPPSQASTVENTIEDRLLIVEDSIVDEQKQRALLRGTVDRNDKQIRKELETECYGLDCAVEMLGSRMDDLENDLQNDLRQEFAEGLEAKALDLQVKLEEFIEHRLEDIEEVVKHDVRMAFENSSCNLKLDLGWAE
ncbi:hypothetical protein E4T48_00362 [Aureobasidium sp. EXF-10727]|nr:hypothetical protein E4T48_00362 [Aureobasidium sp. EXF-10727]KAI4729821.1 hypothetical protein E4T49_02415 [Aureobasidium sp. EXF-10728]